MDITSYTPAFKVVVIETGAIFGYFDSLWLAKKSVNRVNASTGKKLVTVKENN